MMTLKKRLLEDNSKATDHMKSLPEDLIILILVTLPVKSLMRFRCVCKSWYDLIRSPKFIEMHSLYNKHKKNECILIHRMNTHSESVLSFFSYESLNVISPNLKIPQLNFVDPEYSEWNISWPCNGLLLCVSCDSRTFLCNPATREFKLLPPHPIPLPDPDQEPYRAVDKFGLGFDSNKNEYKAYVEVFDVDVDSYISLLYNVSTNSWRQIKSPKTDDMFCGDVQGIPYNGALHWIVERNEIDYNIIVCFDLSTEVFQDIKLPQAIPQSFYIDKILTIVNDCLAMFTFIWSNYFIVESKYVDIWVMKEYGVEESWTKQYSISGIQNTFSYWYPRLLWKNEAILIDAANGNEKQKLLSCALDTHNMTDTRLMNDDYIRVLMVYKESLVSVE